MLIAALGGVLVLLLFVLRDWEAERETGWSAIHEAEKAGDYERAIDRCLDLADRDPAEAANALAHAAHVAVDQLGQFSRGEDLLRAGLDRNPDSQRLLADRVRLMTLTGQRWESLPHLAQYIVRFDVSLPELHWLSDATLVFTDWDLLEFGRRAAPDDPLPLLGLAWDALAAERPEEAVRLLRDCLERDSDLVTANALLGRALVESGQGEVFRQWDLELPAECEDHPAVWRARGDWWRDRNHSHALRCYLEYCRRAPNDPQANWQVSLLLLEEGEAEAAAVFRNRFERILAYDDLTRAVRDHGDYSVVFEAARLAEELLRPAEAFGWYRIAIVQGLGGTADVARMKGLADETPAALVSRFQPDDHIDRTRWPIPAPGSWNEADRSGLTPDGATPAYGPARFRDVAASIGLKFEYFNGVEAGDRPKFLHTVNGGGIGVVDLDCDGWPDLYFTQGGPSPAENSRGNTDHDVLYRNMAGMRADDVTAPARIIAGGYGQGCTVGDFNCDGFPDIFVGNIGANHLFQNCGDGTFQDVTAAAGITGDAWTSSCAFADLNLDSWPDLFEVRYVTADDLFERQCFDSQQVPRPCPPQEFEPARDVVWLNTGDGRFVASPSALDGTSRPGRGLGLLVANFDPQPGLDVFIGNDGTADALLINRTSTSDGALRFDDEAILRGVAANGEGRMQATMGIAMDDVDRDGIPDLFQTNFRGESNTLYLGLGEGYFNDATTQSRLAVVSTPLLGWGTEFLDLELDGWPDLVVLNGHLEDRRHFGDPYRMRAQVFRNPGGGEFVEMEGASVGEWFREPRLARTLARLDWNRDGRQDIAVSSLDSPAALLINDTHPVGNHITVHLRGVTSARDAIGATVTIDAGRQQWVRQLLAGDGYQSRDESTVVLGLGPQSVIDRMTIRWPSNRVQIFDSVAAGDEVLIVEGQPLKTIRASFPTLADAAMNRRQ